MRQRRKKNRKPKSSFALSFAGRKPRWGKHNPPTYKQECARRKAQFSFLYDVAVGEIHAVAAKEFRARKAERDAIRELQEVAKERASRQ